MDAPSPDTNVPIPTLRVLEPSPVDETPPGDNAEYFPQTPSSTALGLTSHHLPYYLLRAQKYSSITFTLFTAMHLTNTSLLPLLTPSLPAATTYLLLTRPYYQSALAEPLLVALPLATHILAGIALRLHRRHAAQTRYAADPPPPGTTRQQAKAQAQTADWPPLSWTSVLGYAAVPLVLGHAAFTRALPLLTEGSSAGVGLDYVGHGVALEPALGFAGYAALIGVAGVHVVWGCAKWAGWTPALMTTGVGAQGRLARKRRWWVLQGVSAAVVLAWAAGGLGVVCRGGRVEGWVGRAYDGMFRQVPILGRAVDSA